VGKFGGMVGNYGFNNDILLSFSGNSGGGGNDKGNDDTYVYDDNNSYRQRNSKADV
jgi:hypothetical protein